jgi:hypothetical protein
LRSRLTLRLAACDLIFLRAGSQSEVRYDVASGSRRTHGASSTLPRQLLFLKTAAGSGSVLRITVTDPSVTKRAQGSTLVQSDMVGFVAFDLVLRIILARVMDIALVVHIHRVDPHDETTNPTSFGIPTHVIADPECPGHNLSPTCNVPGRHS